MRDHNESNCDCEAQKIIYLFFIKILKRPISSRISLKKKPNNEKLKDLMYKN